MGIFTRIGDILTANINALLDKVENPERMLAQIIREMEDGLVTARQQTAAVLAGERRVHRELEQHRAAADTWRARARLALDSERDDLARRALARHLEHADVVKALERQYAEARQASAEVQAALETLEARLSQARTRQRLFEARRQSARVRAEVSAAAGAASLDPRSAFARFGRLENRLADLEDDLLAHAELSAVRSLEIEVTQLETDQRVAQALSALKTEKRDV
jgi:phage shock protein A